MSTGAEEVGLCTLGPLDAYLFSWIGPSGLRSFLPFVDDGVLECVRE